MASVEQKRENKRRNTYQRQLVLNAVKQRCDHPMADDIYRDVNRLDTRISRATVYRNLHLLVDESEIASLHVGRTEHFDRRVDDHAHLVCTVCGCVFDVDAPKILDSMTELEKLTGFDIHAREIIYSGVCTECKKRLEKNAGEAV